MPEIKSIHPAKLKKMAERFILEHYNDFKYKPEKRVRKIKYGVEIFFPDLNPILDFHLTSQELCFDVTFCDFFVDQCHLGFLDVINRDENGKYYGSDHSGKKEYDSPLFDSKYELCKHCHFDELLGFINALDESARFVLLNYTKIPGRMGLTVAGFIAETTEIRPVSIPLIKSDSYEAENLITEFPVIVPLELSERRFYAKLKV